MSTPDERPAAEFPQLEGLRAAFEKWQRTQSDGSFNDFIAAVEESLAVRTPAAEPPAFEFKQVAAFGDPPVNNTFCCPEATGVKICTKMAAEGWEFIGMTPGVPHPIAEHITPAIYLFKRRAAASPAPAAPESLWGDDLPQIVATAMAAGDKTRREKLVKALRREADEIENLLLAAAPAEAGNPPQDVVQLAWEAGYAARNRHIGNPTSIRVAAKAQDLSAFLSSLPSPPGAPKQRT